jgi:NAD(P)-dependent dehydrogenase (short-subunit alcohol dehydrogenase family)
MLTLASAAARARRTPDLRGRTVVVIGGSAGINLETARRARAEGADVILTGEANDQAALERLFDGLPDAIDDVVVTAAAPLVLHVARAAVAKMGPGGSLMLAGGAAISPRFVEAMAVALAPVGVRVNAIDSEDALPVLAKAV